MKKALFFGCRSAYDIATSKGAVNMGIIKVTINLGRTIISILRKTFSTGIHLAR